MLEKHGHWLLVVAALALFAPSLGNGLTNWDDPSVTSASPFVTKGLSGIGDAFTSFHDGAWMPLTHALLTVLGTLFGATEPLPFHLTQWLLFGAAVGLVPFALGAFGVTRPQASLATLLWLAHPFRVESVSWVAATKDTLSLLFLVAAFAIVSRRWLSALCFALALLAKASVAPFALVFAVLEWRRQPGRGALLSSLRWLVPALLVGVIAVVAHRQVMPAVATGPVGPLFVPFWYLGRIVLPVQPRAVYDWAPPTSTGALVALLVVWLGLFLGVAVALRRRPPAPALALGALLFLLPLIPFVGVFPQANPVAERYTLYPSLVVALGLAGLLLHVGRAGVAVAFGLAGVLAVGSVQRQRDWRDSITLWTSEVSLSPEVPAVHLNLAGALGGVGRFEEALTELNAVRRLQPGWPGLDCFIAMARAGKEKLAPGFAVDELKALCRTPVAERWVAAQPIIARKDASSVVVLEELAFGPARAKAAAVAAAFALEKNDFERALLLATQARAWEPSLERALVTQILALVKLERLDDAERLVKTPVSDPQVAARLMGLEGVILNQRGRYAEAELLLGQSAQRLKALGVVP